MNRIKTRIDNTTMYRTVLYALMGLTAWSWVFGFFGLIDFFPVAMAIQLVVILGCAYGTELVLARVYKVKPNLESIFITGFILYFLISPNGTIENLILAAVVGVVAACSKYILAWRGKHIFNPAAIGVTIVGLSGLGYASWWVATPWLVPFVAVAGAVVVYKTRRYEMVLIYLLVSLFVIIGSAVIQNDFHIADSWIIASSYPLIFLACFMLTEPQTLAPRRAQRNLIAGAIAVIANSYVVIGPVAMSPELALVIGNILTACISKKKNNVLQLVSRRKLPGDQVEYLFKSHAPLVFQAGQYAELHLPHIKPDQRGYRRMLTITSSPGINEITFITRHPEPASTFKKTLMKLSIGAQLRVTGVWGDFILPKNPTQKIVWVAGGVGITPFLSQLEWLKRQGQGRDIVLIYAVKNKAEAIDLTAYQNQAHIIIHEGILRNEDLTRYVNDVTRRHAYISGPPVMVTAVKKRLRAVGAKAIRTDFFAGY